MTDYKRFAEMAARIRENIVSGRAAQLHSVLAV